MKINNKDALLKLINSDLNEPDYLKLNIEDLISLKDYMINLKKRKQIYVSLNKPDWKTKIQFIITRIYILCKARIFILPHKNFHII